MLLYIQLVDPVPEAMQAHWWLQRSAVEVRTESGETFVIKISRPRCLRGVRRVLGSLQFHERPRRCCLLPELLHKRGVMVLVETYPGDPWFAYQKPPSD
jgi:hypothetical protein